MSHAYLQLLLSQQAVPEAELGVLRATREELETTLRRTVGAAPRFYYGGSYGKDTMISLAYDLDIVVYFPHTETRPVRDLYATVYRGLRAATLVVEPKTVALRLPYRNGFHIDIVPGRAQDSSFKFATLYKNPNGTLQTSLKMHIDAVRRPGLREVVRLAKLWRARRGVEWSTFALELTVVRALAAQPITDYAEAMLTLWRFMSAQIAGIRLVDPANSGNVIELGRVERLQLLQAANAALSARTWQDVLW